MRNLVLASLMLCLPVYASAQTSQISDNYRSLYADRKAHAVGDTVQVLIVESTQAQSAAGTGSTSSTSVSASGHADNSRAGGGIGISGDARGNGQTTRSGSVRSVVAARITAIDEDGNLRVEAHQEVVINDEKQTIELHGIARPLDISPENEIVSNRLANAVIRISGSGSVSSSQRRGFLFRFLKWTHLL